MKTVGKLTKEDLGKLGWLPDGKENLVKGRWLKCGNLGG